MIFAYSRTQTDVVASGNVPIGLSIFGKRKKGQERQRRMGTSRTTGKTTQEGEGHYISGSRVHSSQSTRLHDHWSTADDCSTTVDSATWVFSVTNRESSRDEFLTDSGPGTSVCQQGLSDTLGDTPSDGIELRSATGRTFITTVSIHVNVSDEFSDGVQDDRLAQFKHVSWIGTWPGQSRVSQIRWKGFQRGYLKSNRVRTCWVQAESRPSAKSAIGTDGSKILMEFEQKFTQSAGAQFAIRGIASVLPNGSQVEQHIHQFEAGVDTALVSGSESWRRSSPETTWSSVRLGRQSLLIATG